MDDSDMDSSVDILDAPDRSSSPGTNGGGHADNLYLSGHVGDSNSPSLDMHRPEMKFPQGGSENCLAEGGNQGNVPRNSGSYTCSSSTNPATARNISKGKEKIEDMGFTGFGLVMDHAKGVDLSCGSPLILEPQLPASHQFDVSPRLVPNGCISPQDWGTKQFNDQAESSFKSEQNFGNISEIPAEDGNYYGSSSEPLSIIPSRINIAQHLKGFTLSVPSEMRGTTASMNGEESSSSRSSRINIAQQVEADEVFALKLRETIWHLYDVPIHKVPEAEAEVEMSQNFERVFRQEEDTVPTTSLLSESQPLQINNNISRLLEGDDTTIFTRYVRILRQHRLRRSTRQSRTQLLLRTSQTSTSPRGRGSAIRSRTRSPLRTFHSTTPNRRRRQAGFPTITLTQLGFDQHQTLPSMTRNFFFPTDMNLDMRLNVIQAMEDFIEDDISGDTFQVQDFSDSDYERYLAQCEDDEQSTDYSTSSSSSSSSDSETFSDSDDNNEEESGLSALQINNLPVSKVQIENSDDVCVICIESPVIGEIVRHLPCLHKFHKDCIDPWLGRKSSCPVCKSTIN